jgi:DNA processing protein
METRALSHTELRDWLRLSRTATVGPVAFRDLLKRYKTPAAALEALPHIVRRKGLSIPSVEAVEAEMAQSETWGVSILPYCDPDYPDYLRAVDPTPPLISLKGRVDILHKPCVGIVGSRNASAIGQRFARQIAGELGERGYTIVSGLARGIDASAHHGAIETGTAGVLGGGVDHIYPRQNAELFRDMAERGALVSESPLGYKATARDFPRRNRIISGLCKGIVVIEAAEKSGTLITARYAMEQNREVMAAPGSPLDPRTKGCNRLIQNGAALIEGTDDIIDVLNHTAPLRVSEPDSDYGEPEFDWEGAQKDIDLARQIILGLLSPTPTSRDEIIRQSGFPTPFAAAALLEMELSGDVHVEPDGRVALNLGT